MAEGDLIATLREAAKLPKGPHYFCPRASKDDSEVFYDEDLPCAADVETPQEKEKRLKSIEEANFRTTMILECLQILAFSGNTAVEWTTWLKQSVDEQLTTCDVCIRRYYRARPELVSMLSETYDEEGINRFMVLLDDYNIARIRQGLEKAEKLLLEAPQEARTTKLLMNEKNISGLYAIFEALSCTALLQNEVLLTEIFDQPFELLQSRRYLKVGRYVPAMTTFAFGTNEFRVRWALFTWKQVTKTLTRADFDAAVRDQLLEAMKRGQAVNWSPTFLSLFWACMNEIVKKLDKELITHSLRALDIDIYRLALDHLAAEFQGSSNLLHTVQELLEKSPTDFWDAMGTISPATVAEQILSSGRVKEILIEEDAANSGSSKLNDVFTWITPFVDSIKPINLTPACRALVNQLMNRIQSGKSSIFSKRYCHRLGLQTLLRVLRILNSSKSQSTFVGAATVADMLDLIWVHLKSIITEITTCDPRQPLTEAAKLGLDVVQQTLTLDCISLEVEKAAIVNGNPLLYESKSSAPVWDAIALAASSSPLDMGLKALAGARSLVGIEKVFTKPSTAVSKEIRHYNARFSTIASSLTKIIEQLGNFKPEKLHALFATTDSTSSVTAMLLSSDEEVRKAMVELLKVVSDQDGRFEAIEHLFISSYSNAATAFSTTIRRVAQKKIFAPTGDILHYGKDVVETLCNSQNGILRARTLSQHEIQATEGLWQAFWQILTTIFDKTESWSNSGYEKQRMIEFCRDSMQFADTLFDQYSILATALQGAIDPDSATDRAVLMKRLLKYPTETLRAMATWLRLRDEYLSTKSVSLTCKLLGRLREVRVEVPEVTLHYIRNIISGDTRAKLTGQQLAELDKALEPHLGHLVIVKSEPVKSTKQGSLSTWVSGRGIQSRSVDPSADLSGDSDAQLDKLLSDSSRTASAQKLRLDRFRKRQTLPVVNKKPVPPKNTLDVSEFKKKREMEKEAKKKRDALALAQAKKNLTEKGAGMMVSSDESEDDVDPMDRELFGLTKSSKKHQIAPRDAKSQITENISQLPIKKKKIVRSARDMRARLAPDLSPLHMAMLAWEYFHDGDFPPNSRHDTYTEVPGSFRAPDDYQNTFKPLIMLEAWQGFVKSREENTFKAYTIKISSRSSVDSFVEVASTMDHVDNREIGLSEGDIILLSLAPQPTASAGAPHCLARVNRVMRKKAHMEITYRVVPGNPLIQSLVAGGILNGAKVHSITPLEREYGALLGLQYYDLCDEIIKAKPSPLLSYSEKQLAPIITNYSVNPAQAKAVRSAMDNDCFTLIQGPPGSGKTKTIIAIVGALLSDTFRDKGTIIARPAGNNFQPKAQEPAPKKLLICAPSNAAVDELVMRLKAGIKTMAGAHKNINVVRLGRSDAVNSNVVNVTLDELVNARLNIGQKNQNSTEQREQTQKLMTEHQQVSAQVREARDKLDNSTAKGDEYIKIKNDFDLLRKRKSELGAKIDNAKDTENNISRQAELNRKLAQQQILNESHVICATLSGSGHEMFQALNVEFETVVVDEAAQCVEMSAIIPLKYGCSKCILVGDPKQLPPTVFSKVAAKFQYEKSLFVRMQTNHPNDVHLLDTQYRMHPEISCFPSETFYDSRLLDGPDMGKLRHQPWHASALLGPYRFFDVQGQHQAAPKGHSLINLAEIEIAIRLYTRLTADYKGLDWKGKIGIITPYKSQLRELKDRFSRRFGQSVFDEVEFNTTDAYQGRESEIIIFSCVRASPAGGIGFLSDIRRMNVGLTRAKSSLWVLGNSQSLVKGEYWRRLIEDAKKRDRYTTGNLDALLSKSTAAKHDKATSGNPYKDSRRERKTESDATKGNTSLNIDTLTSVAKDIKMSNSLTNAASDQSPVVDGHMQNYKQRLQEQDQIDDASTRPIPKSIKTEAHIPLKTEASSGSSMPPKARLATHKRKQDTNPLIIPRRAKKPKASQTPTS